VVLAWDPPGAAPTINAATRIAATDPAKRDKSFKVTTPRAR
jgi:hypothetical protein